MAITKRKKKTYKRIFKKIFTEENVQEKDERILIARIDGDIDQTEHQYLVKAKDEDEVISIFENIIPIDGIEAAPSIYDCTGQPFCDPAMIKQVAAERFYVVQRIHYDL